jgi:hypothetical protein
MLHRKAIYDITRTSKWITMVNFVPVYIMNILSATFAFALLRHSATFGSYPECNSAARVFFFTTFKASHGWFVAVAVFHAIPLAIMSFLLIIRLATSPPFLATILHDKQRLRNEGASEAVHQSSAAGGCFKRDCFHIAIVFVSLAIWIAFTELTIAKNRFTSVGGTIWQFGQVLHTLFSNSLPNA